MYPLHNGLPSIDFLSTPDAWDEVVSYRSLGYNGCLGDDETTLTCALRVVNTGILLRYIAIWSTPGKWPMHNPAHRCQNSRQRQFNSASIHILRSSQSPAWGIGSNIQAFVEMTTSVLPRILDAQNTTSRLNSTIHFRQSIGSIQSSSQVFKPRPSTFSQKHLLEGGLMGSYRITTNNLVLRHII